MDIISSISYIVQWNHVELYTAVSLSHVIRRHPRTKKIKYRSVLIFSNKTQTLFLPIRKISLLSMNKC